MKPIGSGIELELVPVACAVCGSSDTKPTPVFEGYDFEYRTCNNKFRFVACSACGHVYLSPCIRVEDVERIYPVDYLPHSMAPAYPVFRPVRWLKLNVFDRGWIRQVLAHLREGSNVLEIGAGTGSQLQYMACTSPFTLALFANDLHFNELVRAALVDDNIVLFEGPIDRVHSSRRFDAIICMHIIEHLVDPRQTLLWIAEHLAPGGILYLETPDLGAPARFLFRNHWASLSFPRHFHLFSRAKIADLFTGCGLQIVSHHSVVEASAWTVSIRNRLGMDFSVRKKGILGVIDYRNVIARTFFSAVDLVSMWCGFSTSTQALIARKPAGAG